jgi:hypothetical protein
MMGCGFCVQGIGDIFGTFWRLSVDSTGGWIKLGA